MRRRPAMRCLAALALASGTAAALLTGCSPAPSGTEVSVELRSDLPARTYRVDVFDGAGRRVWGGDLPPGSVFSVHTRTETVKVDVAGVCILTATGPRVHAAIAPGSCAI